jgi:hypothetical protein
MRTRRIELDSSAGHLAIERQPNTINIRIDSILRDPAPGSGQEVIKTWTITTRISDEDLFAIATQVQARTDGYRGTNSDIHDYYRELQRFQD